MGSSSVIPPPPPGFVLEGGGIPPPPLGFILEASGTRPAPSGRMESEGLMDRARELLSVLQRPQETLTGAGKRLLQYGHTASAGLMGFPQPETFQPVGPLQEGGAQALDIASFLPTGGISGFVPAAARNAPRLTRLAALAGKAGAEGAGTAGVAALQGQTPGEVATAGSLGAAVPLAGGVKAALKAGAAERLAPRIINSLVKPISKEFEFGKNAGRGVASEGIKANSLEQLGEKVAAVSERLRGEVDKILSPIKTQIDIAPTFKPVDDAIAQAVKDGDEALLGRLRHFKDQLTHEFAEQKGKLVKAKAKPTSLTPLEANQVKREIGRQTKWREGDQYADDINKLGVQIWKGISDLIEKAAPAVKFKNSRWADIISAQKAIERRATIEARRDLSGLYPVLTGLSGAVASLASGDQGPESIAKGLAAGAMAKGLGSTAVKTRAAAALARPGTAESPLLALLRSLFLGTSQSRSEARP